MRASRLAAPILLATFPACSGAAPAPGPSTGTPTDADSGAEADSGTTDTTASPCPGHLHPRPLANGWVGARGAEDCLAVTAVLVRSDAALAAALATVDPDRAMPDVDWRREQVVFAMTGTCQYGSQDLQVTCARPRATTLEAGFALIWPDTVATWRTHAWSITAVDATLASDVQVGSVVEAWVGDE